ncbi:MAG TPA: tetratricopeptide repeat protein [Terriglobales bacterium]|nr:tetratricopeptide repeat protein [Terriglobales bacterium]
MDRLQALKDILAQDPNNAFARYGLAMELSHRGETDNALAEFHTLIKSNPDYTPGYFMAAQTLSRAGRNEEAKQLLRDGIASAQRTGNGHAESEMQGMLDELGG